MATKRTSTRTRSSKLLTIEPPPNSSETESGGERQPYKLRFHRDVSAVIEEFGVKSSRFRPKLDSLLAALRTDPKQFPLKVGKLKNHRAAKVRFNRTTEWRCVFRVGQLGLNLLDGLTPNTAAGFLEAAFKLLGQGEGDSAFWLSLAVARSQAALAVLFHVPGAYSLKGLYEYVFDERFRKAAIATAGDTLLELQVLASDGNRDASLDARRLKNAIDYEATIAAQYSEKERSGVNRTIETALARFADPELEDAFCGRLGAYRAFLVSCGDSVAARIGSAVPHAGIRIDPNRLRVTDALVPSVDNFQRVAPPPQLGNHLVSGAALDRKRTDRLAPRAPIQPARGIDCSLDVHIEVEDA